MTTYSGALDWLDLNHPFMVTPLINLGRPTFDVNIPTAQIEKTERGDDFRLVINPDFFADHTEPECAGILTHELYHVIFNHLSEFDKFENNQARIIAQECIVNDSVLEEGMQLPDIGLHFGNDWVQYNTSFLPTKVVYDDLMKNPEKLPPEEDLDIQCSHGKADKDAREAFKKLFKDADLSDAPEAIKGLLEDAAQKAGSGFSFKQETGTGRKIGLKWAQLINEIHPDTFSDGGKSKATATWSRPRRKLAGMPERIMLPDRKDKKEFGFGGNKRPKILLALDTSTSIPRDKVQELLDLANTIPKKKVDVICCTFSTYPEELYPDQSVQSQKIAGGGTDFDAVVKFLKAQPNYEKIPVIVVTDGGATFGGWSGRSPLPANAHSHWHWLVFKGYRIDDRRVTKNIYEYEDFVA